jgi:hypothetical protein
VIPRISKGKSAYGALGYDHGRARDERSPHENPHKIAGNVPGRRWQDRARAIDAHIRSTRPDAAKPLHRTSLRIAEDDRRPTDREWKQIAQRYVQAMGFAGCPWEATRHADDHIHLSVCRIRWDGGLARTSHDYARAQAACRTIEREHHLIDASRRYDRRRPQLSRGEQESAARRGVAPEKHQLRDRLLLAEKISGGTRAGYERALATHGVRFRVNVSASTGRVSGYSYHLPGHHDRGGAQVWLKGSQLGRDYSWAGTEARLSRLVETQHGPTVARTPPPGGQGAISAGSLTRGQAQARAAAEAARRAHQRGAHREGERGREQHGERER